jgi:hypothetical protein
MIMRRRRRGVYDIRILEHVRPGTGAKTGQMPPAWAKINQQPTETVMAPL